MIKRGAELDLERAARYFVRWWREEGGLIAAADAGGMQASLDMMGCAAADVQGERRRIEDDRVAVQGWGFDFEWQVEKEQETADLSSMSAASAALFVESSPSPSSSRSNIPAPSTMSFKSLSPAISEFVQRKMEKCIDRYLAGLEAEEKEGKDVSETQRRKREVKEEKQRRAEKRLTKR